MLPRSLLSYALRGDVVEPRYLTSDDEAWVHLLIHELGSLAGRTQGDVDRILTERLSRIANEHRVPLPAAAAVRHILEKQWRLEIKAAAPPGEIRRVVFELAADVNIPRSEVLGRAAATLGIRAEEVAEGLFADRPSERRLSAPQNEPSVHDVIDRHNMALAQGLLLRSEHIVARVKAHAPFVVRAVKEAGLICFYSIEGAETTMRLSGPVALPKNSLKYGLALARFFPALALTPDWSLDATCQLHRGNARFHADASDPIEATHALPQQLGGLVQNRLATDFRRLGSPWSIRRETTALEIAGGVSFPDFTLEAGDRRVYVEAVGFHTPEHLESKLRGFREAGLPNVVLCVDESMSCGDGESTAAQVVRFRKRIEPERLLEAANRCDARPTDEHDPRRERS